MTDKSESPSNWFLMESWPGMMLTAKVEIVGRRVEFLLPETWRRAKVDGRDQPHSSPRLPGQYAFVQIFGSSIDEQIAALLTLRGVRTVFKNSLGRYARVPEWEIQALKEAAAAEHREAGKAKPKQTETRFKAGARVRIMRHPTAEGHVGEFLYSVRGQSTLAMENGIKMDIPEFDLAEVDEPRRRAG